MLARPDPEKWYPPSAWLPEVTNGLISFTLVVTVTVQIILIAGILLAVCRFSPREIGLDLTKLPSAVVLTLIAWAATQIVLVIVFAIFDQEIALNAQWIGPDWTWIAGRGLGQLLGNTLLEEVIFRGFLLPQCLLLSMIWMPRARPATQITIALLVSQSIFTLLHVFFNAREPQGQWLLLAQFAMGMLFAAVYIRTGNLFLAMGLHTLANNPSPLLKDDLLSGPGVTFLIISVGTLVAVTIGPSLARRLGLGSKKTSDPSSLKPEA